MRARSPRMYINARPHLGNKPSCALRPGIFGVEKYFKNMTFAWLFLVRVCGAKQWRVELALCGYA